MSNNVKKMVTTALLIATGIILPFAFHSIPNSGSIFLPMHIPILICGIILGWKYGFICGFLTPFLSSILTGMPPMAYLPIMLFELSVYGLVSGLVFNLLKSEKIIPKIYISLISAMILGRLTYGIMNAVYFRVGAYSLKIWLTSAFVTSLPGIIIQLIFVPVVVLALISANLVDLNNQDKL